MEKWNVGGAKGLKHEITYRQKDATHTGDES
jgi:hypothetical protein